MGTPQVTSLCDTSAFSVKNVASHSLSTRTASAQPKILENVSVLFVDMRGYSCLASQQGTLEQHQFLHHVYSRFDSIIESHRVQRVKTNGDQYIAAAGIHAAHESRKDEIAALRICHAAVELLIAFNQLAKALPFALGLRIGIASGEVVIAPIGQTSTAPDLFGLPMILAARLEQFCHTNQILVCERTHLATRSFLPSRTAIDAELKGLGRQRFFQLDLQTLMRR